MKNKIIVSVFAFVLIISFALGATGRVQLVNAENAEKNGAQDRLIGVLLTREYLDLFDYDSFLQDNFETIVGHSYSINYNDQRNYTQRKTATLVDDQITFDGIEGIVFAELLITEENGEQFHTTQISEEFSNVRAAYHYADEGEKNHIEADVILASVLGTTEEGKMYIYMNPIYQTETGEVYVVSGMGQYFDLNNEFSSSQSMKEEKTLKNNGEVQKKEMEVVINFRSQKEPDSYKVLQLNGENEILSEAVYAFGEMPEEVKTEKDTEYIILEKYTLGEEKAEREIFQQDDSYFNIIIENKNGYLVQKMCTIIWED